MGELDQRVRLAAASHSSLPLARDEERRALGFSFRPRWPRPARVNQRLEEGSSGCNLEVALMPLRRKQG